MIFNNIYEYYMFIGLVHGSTLSHPMLEDSYFRIQRAQEAYLLGFDIAKYGDLKIGDLCE